MLLGQREGHRPCSLPSRLLVKLQRRTWRAAEASVSHRNTTLRRPHPPPHPATRVAAMGLISYYSYGLPTFTVLVVALYLLFTGAACPDGPPQAAC